MIELEVTTSLPVRRIVRIINNLPRAATGQRGGAGAEPRLLLIRVGEAVLQVVSDAFKVKAMGATDAAGLTWTALSPVTLRRRKSNPRARPPWGSKTEILRATGDLLRSLTPGVRSQRRPTTKAPAVAPKRQPLQVFRISQGEVEVGTSRPHAEVHHQGSATILQRRLWQELHLWPSAWQEVILVAGAQGIFDVLVALLQRG